MMWQLTTPLRVTPLCWIFTEELRRKLTHLPTSLWQGISSEVDLLHLLFVPIQSVLTVCHAAELAEDRDPLRFIPWSWNNKIIFTFNSSLKFCRYYFCVHQHACKKRKNLHHAKISCYIIYTVLWQQYNCSYSILRSLLEYWSGFNTTSACTSPAIHFNACWRVHKGIGE